MARATGSEPGQDPGAPHGHPSAAQRRTGSWVLAQSAGSVADARQVTRQFLGDEQLFGDAESAVLVVSELVANAVRHARAQPERLELKMEVASGGLRIEVIDADPSPPVPQRPHPEEESGRGLQIVQGVVDRWGWDRRPGDGKRVWCDLSDPL